MCLFYTINAVNFRTKDGRYTKNYASFVHFKKTVIDLGNRNWFIDQPCLPRDAHQKLFKSVLIILVAVIFILENYTEC